MQTATMKKSDRPVETTVADVAGNLLTLAAGSAAGVNVGDVFEILRVVRTVKDPATGEVLDQITDKSGELTITNARERISTVPTSGRAPRSATSPARKSRLSRGGCGLVTTARKNAEKRSVWTQLVTQARHSSGFRPIRSLTIAAQKRGRESVMAGAGG